MSNHTNLTNQVPAHPIQVDFTSLNESLREMHNPSPIPLLPNLQLEVPSFSRPSDLFAVKQNRCTVPAYRFIRKNNIRQMLMFVDGACSNNGLPDALAGWAVCLGPGLVVKGRLEPEVGSSDGQTSNRAELRSAIVALGLRYWRGEGFNSVVIASDSEYVVKGYCERLEMWKQRDWKTARGTDVRNKDLWEALDFQIQSLAKVGVQVLFWRIPREWNEADKYAKEAATQDLDGTTTSSAPIFLVAC